MRGALRIALRIIKWCVIVGVAALLLVLLVNLRDEELTPEARALAELQTPDVPDAQNVYLALVGFDAPSGVDPTAEGARIVAEKNAAALDDPSGVERISKVMREGYSVRDEGRLRFIGDAKTVSDPLGRPILPAALERARDIREMSDANAELIARYLAMQKLPAFADTTLPDMFSAAPLSVGWGAPRNVLLMRSALDAQTGQVARSLEFLAADIGMWRRVLGGGGAVIVNMIAVRALAGDYRILSDLIASPAFDARAHEAELRQILVPLSGTELNGAPMIKREFQMNARWFPARVAAQYPPAPWFDRLMSGSLFYPILDKPMASLNLSAPLYSGLRTLASHPPSDFVRLRKELERDVQALSEPRITWIYNPMGRLTAGMAIPWYPEYVARVFDLAAYVQLVRAQLELRLASVARSEVPGFLASGGPETRNPYTGQPFQWSVSDNSLSFEPMSSRWREWSTKAAVPPPL